MDSDELFQKALQSRKIKEAFLAKELLEFLYENQERIVSSVEIAATVFDDHRPVDAERRVRERIYDLKKRLEDFEVRFESDIRFDIPDATVGPYGGYRLRCVKKDPLAPAKVFWKAHTASNDVQFLYAEPAFFFDPDKASYIRYYDVNPSGNDSHSAVAELNAKHGIALKRLLGADPMDKLSPRHVFIGLGEMEAMDVLSEWFRRESFLNTRRNGSQRVLSLQEAGGCPVVFGNARSNHLLQAAFDSKDGKRFCYRQHDTLNGFITIQRASEDERQALRDFKVSEDHDGQISAGLAATLSPLRDRLALIHRIKVPGGEGSATLISSDYTFGIRQVATALTNDKQAAEIMRRTGWREQKIPEVFEMIFKVQSAPMYFEHDADKAELLAWRPR
jgi:hypothetical protein